MFQALLSQATPDASGAVALLAVTAFSLRSKGHSAMSMYAAFRTDEHLEQQGVDIDYGEFVVTLARAGGSNQRFKRRLRELSKPFRRGNSTSVPEEIQEKLYCQAFAERVVLNWQRRVDGQMLRGIEAEDGSTLEFTAQNVQLTLQKLPDLFEDLVRHAVSHTTFQREAESGN